MEQKEGLKRVLGFWPTWAICIGLTVSGSICLATMYGFAHLGAGFLVPLAAAAIIVFCLVTSFMELALMLPKAGAAAFYTMPALGRVPGISIGLVYLVIFIFIGPVEFMILGHLFSDFVFTGVPWWIFPLIFAAIFVFLNFRGIGVSGVVQLALAAIMVIIILLLGIFGISGFASGTVISPHPFAPFIPQGVGVMDILEMTMLLGIFCFMGLDWITPLVEEIKDPVKTLPRAIPFAIATIFGCFAIFGLAGVMYVKPDVVLATSVPHIVIAQTLFGKLGLVAMLVAALGVSLTTMNAAAAEIPRVYYSMATIGLFPSKFGYLHPKYRTPWWAILLVLGLTFPLFIYSIFIGEQPEFLIEVAAWVWVIMYAIISVDLIILRRKYPKAKRPYKVPLYPAPQIIGLAFALIIIVFAGSKVILAGLGVLAVLFTYSVIWTKFFMKKPLFKPVPIEEEISS